MNNSQLKQVLKSLSSLEDRLIMIRDKFDEHEDYQFECNGFDSNQSSLCDLISVALAALDEIYEKSECDTFLLNRVERDF